MPATKESIDERLKKSQDKSTEEELKAWVKEQEEQEWNILVESLEEVVVIPSQAFSDPDIWRIKMGGKYLEILTSKLDGPKVFRQHYIKVFRACAPKILNKKWHDFMGLMGSIAVDGDIEEDTKLFVCEEILSNIAKLEITSDKVAWLSGSYLMEREGYLCYPSSGVSEMLREMNMKIDIGQIATVYNQTGKKLSGTKKIYINNQGERTWWFFLSAINKFKKVPIVLNGGKLDE